MLVKHIHRARFDRLFGTGEGGEWIEQKYYSLLKEIEEKGGNDKRDPNNFPVNTHGGLLAFGAPWEVRTHVYSITKNSAELLASMHRRLPCTTSLRL